MSHFAEKWGRLAELPVSDAVKQIFRDKKQQCLVCETQELRRILGPGGPGLTMHGYADTCAKCALCMLDDFKLLYDYGVPEEVMMAYFDFVRECIPCMWRHLKKGLDAHGITGPIPQEAPVKE